MKSRKEILIETLHGSLNDLENLPELIDQETIYDETGHVDCVFLTSILEWMCKAVDISMNVQKSLNRLIGVDDLPSAKKKGAEGGEKWSAEEILKNCTLTDNVMKLPNVQFNKKSYAEAKKRIEEAGGSWLGGKVQGFTFPFNAERVFSELKEKGKCNLQKDFQFFETPDHLADWIVSLAGVISCTDKVLEPSAGRGALVRAIHRKCNDIIVDCCELMPENREILKKMDGIKLIEEDFTKIVGRKYNKIIANPPFAKNQDIRHVRLMYHILEKGGTIAAITSRHWQVGQEKECMDFRSWVKEIGAEIYEIEEGTFNESGTGIGTLAVVINKN